MTTYEKFIAERDRIVDALKFSDIPTIQFNKDAAARWNAQVHETHLKNQFRCMGSNDYLEWLNYTLGYSKERKILKKNELFEFRIFDTPTDLYNALYEKEISKPNSARLTAGFCWPWSKTLGHDGLPVNDVVIGKFSMPWETHGEIKRIPHGYVSWDQWAIKPEGFKQVGCIYTAQGFEFEYVGVIFADDLKFDHASNGLKGNMSAHKDPTLLKSKEAEFDKYVRNIYRVLMSRGLKGCYMYFVNNDTRAYFESHIE